MLLDVGTMAKATSTTSTFPLGRVCGSTPVTSSIASSSTRRETRRETEQERPLLLLLSGWTQDSQSPLRLFHTLTCQGWIRKNFLYGWLCPTDRTLMHKASYPVCAKSFGRNHVLCLWWCPCIQAPQTPHTTPGSATEFRLLSCFCLNHP